MSCPVHYKLATLSVLTVTPPCDFDFAGCFPPSNSPSFRLCYYFTLQRPHLLRGTYPARPAGREYATNTGCYPPPPQESVRGARPAFGPGRTYRTGQVYSIHHNFIFPSCTTRFNRVFQAASYAVTWSLGQCFFWLDLGDFSGVKASFLVRATHRVASSCFLTW